MILSRRNTSIIKFRPSLRLDAVTSIDPEALARSGVRAVLLDLDNTIVSYHQERADRAVEAWIRRLAGVGIATLILSNNHTPRVKGIASHLGVPFVADAKKPLRAGYRRALDVLGVTPAETLVVGDQLFTDVFGGNRFGMRTVLVRPIGRTEFIGTRFVRPVERIFLWGIERQRPTPNHFKGGQEQAL